MALLMLDFLHIAAKEARDQLLYQQLLPRRISKEIPAKKRPIAFDDGDQERAHKKMRFDRNLSERRPTTGIVIREPDSCNNPFSDHFSEKSNLNANDDKGKKKAEKRRKRTRDCEVKKQETLPDDVRRKIEEKARLGGEEDLKIVLVIQKNLETSDVKRQQNRVTIPSGQIQNKFLTPQQEEELEQKIGSHYVYVTIPIIEPSGRVDRVQMRRWNVGKQSTSYVLNCDWKYVVEFNQLREDQTMQLWAFWIRGMLNFAFVVLPGGGPPDINDVPQTGCLIMKQFAEAENSNSRSKDSEQTEPRWSFDLNLEPELE